MDPRIEAEIAYRQAQVRRDWQAAMALGRWVSRIREAVTRKGTERASR